MTVVVAGMLSESFRRGANDAALQRILWHLREQQEVAKKNNPALQKESKTDTATDMIASVISLEQADAFQADLDIFQDATVEAIMEFDEAIEVAEEELEILQRNSHVLEDGRRVFKTRDGQRVFDESGQELTEEVIHPDEISDEYTKWEDVLEKRQQLRVLEQKRTDVIEFQDKLDEAQELLDRGSLTEQEFDDLREDIYNSAPQAVRDIAGQRGLEFGNDQPSITADTPHPDAPASDINIDLDDELASLPTPAGGPGMTP